MSELGYKAFDADHHYYEAEDAFTRHIDPKMAKRAMQWGHVGGKQRLLVGGKINRFIPNPTFDPVSKPGALEDYYRGRMSAGGDIRKAFGDLEPIDPAYRDRDVRLKVLKTQQLEGAFFFPTLGVGMEEALKHDTPALCAAFRAFNRWLDDDWGLRVHGRDLRGALHHPRGSRLGRGRDRATSRTRRANRRDAIGPGTDGPRLRVTR